jgi:predicted metal-dependent hydrolase
VIYLNPESVKAPGSCIDYVVTHELCHLGHGNHGPAFYGLLGRVMPDWEQRKRRLEREGAETGCPAAHPCVAEKRCSTGAKR